MQEVIHWPLYKFIIIPYIGSFTMINWVSYFSKTIKKTIKKCFWPQTIQGELELIIVSSII